MLKNINLDNKVKKNRNEKNHLILILLIYS
jgi:hypothetical protein